MKIQSRRGKGFTIIEVLLALGLSSFIMIALVQSYQILVKYLDSARKMALMNQRIALVTNVLEKDLMVACMPQIFPVVESNKEKGLSGQDASVDKAVVEQGQKRESEEDKKKKAEERINERKKYFFTEIDDADFHKIRGKRVELLKSCNFITTHALEAYSQSSQRWVRVRYELVKDKKAKKQSYSLIRKQTTDIANLKMKISEIDPTANSKEHPIASYEILKGIKGLFIEFSRVSKPEKPDEVSAAKGLKKEEEPEVINSFQWGEGNKTAGHMPERAHVYIDLWDEDEKDSQLIELKFTMPSQEDPEEIMQQSSKGLAARKEGVVGVKSGQGGVSGANNPMGMRGAFGDQQDGRISGQPGNVSPAQAGQNNDQGSTQSRSDSEPGTGTKPSRPTAAPGLVDDMLSLLSGAFRQ